MTEQDQSATLRARPLNPSVQLIETPMQLAAANQTLAASSGPFAIDAERASGFKYFQRAYLIQITRVNCPIYLIDPISILDGDPSAFDALSVTLASDEWILHAATQDLPCLAEVGLKPTALFDTELAGRLLGCSRVGLGALCEDWLGITLAKEHSAVDWSQRPLHDDWLNYAALDVDVLLDLRLAAISALDEAGKTEWAKQDFERLLAFEPKPQKADKWRSMSGLHEVKDQRSLAIAESMWVARDKLASKLDVSPGRLVPDLAIVAAAKEKPKSRSALAGFKAFNGRASRTYLDTWWQALTEGMEAIKLPELRPALVGMPNHKNWPNRHPEAHARLQAARPEVVAIAEANQLPVENLLQPDLLRQLCWQPPTEINEATVSAFLLDGGARKWQCDLVVQPVVEALLSAAAGPAVDVTAAEDPAVNKN